MAQLKKPVTTIGNGHSVTPILANAAAPTVAESKPSRTSTSIESGSTRPLSIAEGLSLWQTLCYDLRSMGCEVAILARGNRLYMILATPASSDVLQMEDGQIVLNNKPVILAERETK